MELILQDIGKQFNRQWIFNGINFHIHSNTSTAIIGNNGTGKSTLIQLLYNFQTQSKGTITYLLNQQEITNEDVSRHISFVAPYLELPEEFTLNELIQFHFKLRSKNNLFEIQIQMIDDNNQPYNVPQNAIVNVELGFVYENDPGFYNPATGR
jgi:ABC-type multidrug transport system ATPase subunit